MKTVLIVLALIVGGLIAFFTSLQNGSFLRLLDTHPNPTHVPRIEYTIASAYYMLNDLDDAATYYQRIYQRFPASPYTDDAFFGYIQSLEETNLHRGELVELYETYVEKYPEGKHVDVINKRLEYSKTRH